MNHPFGLELSDLEAIELDFVEELTEEESAKVGGGMSAAESILGEQGGWIKIPPIEIPPIKLPSIKLPPGYPTTEAFGEDGDVTTLALGEEGGSIPVGLESF